MAEGCWIIKGNNGMQSMKKDTKRLNRSFWVNLIIVSASYSTWILLTAILANHASHKWRRNPVLLLQDSITEVHNLLQLVGCLARQDTDWGTIPTDSFFFPTHPPWISVWRKQPLAMLCCWLVLPSSPTTQDHGTLIHIAPLELNMSQWVSPLMLQHPEWLHQNMGQ